MFELLTLNVEGNVTVEVEWWDQHRAGVCALASLLCEWDFQRSISCCKSFHRHSAAFMLACVARVAEEFVALAMPLQHPVHGHTCLLVVHSELTVQSLLLHEAHMNDRCACQDNHCSCLKREEGIAIRM